MTPTEKIQRWINARPSDAVKLAVAAVGLGSHQQILMLTGKDLDKPCEALTEMILEACEAWTEAARKESRFLCQWLDASEHGIYQLQFHILPPASALDGLPKPDGSLESLIAGLQATGLQQHKLMIDMAKAVVELILSIVESQQARIHFLEGQEIEVRRLKNEILDITSGDSTDQQRFNRLMGLFQTMIQKGQSQGQGHVKQVLPPQQ